MRSGRIALRAKYFSVAVALLLLAPPVVRAQAAPTGPTLTGRVVDPAGKPIPGVAVQVRASEGPGASTGRAVTDEQGRFTVPLTTGVPEYLLSAERTGFVSSSMLVPVPGGAHVVTREVTLSPVPSEPLMLEGIVAVAARRVPTSARQSRAPGEVANSDFPFTSETYPIEPGDLVASAVLTAGVIPSGGDGVSIAGQPASQNRTTLDGAGYGASSIPREAVAAAGVITHPYDVSRGQFTGGEIAATTRSGTSLWGGALSLTLEDPRLQYDAAPASPGRGHSLWQVSGGGGGPLVPGRLYGYGAGQVSTRHTATSPLSVTNPSLSQLGVVPDSIERFGEIVQRLGFGTPQEGDGGLRTTSGSALARFDYLPGERHSVMLRMDARGLRSSGIGTSPTAFTRGGELGSTEGGALLQLASAYGRFHHELSAYGSRGRQYTDPGIDGPAGEVRIGSDAEEAQSASWTFRFGAAPLPASELDRSSFELTDRLTLAWGDGTHELRLGGTYAGQRIAMTGGSNRYGTFTFGSLADLEAGRPLSYTRSLADLQREIATGYAAVYAGDVWTAHNGVSLTYGLRAERRWYASPQGGNPIADSLFGVRTGRISADWGVSPRFGFSYVRRNLLTVRGGIGEFRGAPPLQSLASLLAESGAEGANAQLLCLGAAAPVPEWESYAADVSLIPSLCTQGQPHFSDRFRSVASLSPDYVSPRLWRSSVGVTWYPRRDLAIYASASASRGLHHPLASDLNLDPSPAFHLASEGNRPVYVSPESIDAASGRSVPRQSRREPSFGTVREVSASGRSATEQVTIEASRMIAHGYVSAAYTASWSRDQTTGIQAPGGSQASTAGDPSDAEWAPRDHEQRHAFQLRLSRSPTPNLQVTLIGRLTSGIPFSPLVDGDVNGDGQFNDRAFVFDPAKTADPDLARDMRGLLHRVPGAARECLAGQMGTLASRNSCRTPWSPALDVQLNVYPRGRRDRRLFFTITAQNTVAGADYLLHGADGLRGWGQTGFTDPVLLHVRGFDAASQRFRYEVNPAFGTRGGEPGNSGVPFSIRIQGRVTVGADPAAHALQTVMTRIDAMSRPEEIRRHVREHLPNFPAEIVEVNESAGLSLTPEQTARLQAAADSLSPHVAAVVEMFATSLSLPSSQRTPEQSIEELMRRGQALIDAGFQTARSVLTPAQWARLPARLRTRPDRIPLPSVSFPTPF